MKYLLTVVGVLGLLIGGALHVAAQSGADLYGAADLAREVTSGGVTGTATFAHAGSGTHVTLSLLGLPAGSQATGQVHQGRCAGAVLVTLAAAAGPDGTAQSSGDIAAVLDFTAGDRWFLDLQLAPEPLPGSPLCAEVAPAMAKGGPAPPPIAPGMPATGVGSWEFLGPVFGAGALLVLGCRLRLRLRGTR
ncbi:MAG TPA: hypothetical protein VM536_17910 [Chloroflexia bacterium]|nr:hypothetical protein [Chloroflexia bacterium]